MDQDLLDLKQKFEDGAAIKDLSDEAQEKVQKYFEVRHYGSKITAVFREDQIQKAKQYHSHTLL